MVTVLAMHEQNNWLLKLIVISKLAWDSAKAEDVAILGDYGCCFTFKTILKTDLLEGFECIRSNFRSSAHSSERGKYKCILHIYNNIQYPH